ncbi:MAG: BamA/TamA family outer membrane protein [Bacteroidetes bacterium]|nr:BamA/TamA family outer membrane protein [Bacteroidota bacterium]
MRVENDSIDLEMRLYEGKQATINKVYIRGNTKTNDRVVLREIRTQPGQLFNRSDVIRTVRELAQLGYFDQEKLNPSPKANTVDGSVDMEYNVEERPSDQLQLSGGYGNNQLVGTLGLSFTNFSARNIFKGKEYTPLPAGDGQRLSIQAQSSGRNFQSYNLSFTEPWLGGKKPNAFTATIYHSRSNSFSGGSNLRLSGLTFGLGKRIRWPDDFFSLYYDIGFNIIEVVTPEGSIPTYQFENGTISNGTSNNFNLGVSLSRNSIDAPIYPRRGGSFAASVSATPPYSFFNSIDYKTASASEKFKWIEYHKWKFTSSWFTKIADNLVVAARMQYGFLGIYNRAVGASPFERFFIGGDGMTGFNFFESREIISMRGYDQNDLTPLSNRQAAGATIYTKYTMELRYPVSLNPNATIYILGFAEAGNGFLKFRDFSPFNVKRAAGAGVRIFLPMFGLLGLDWGYGFDNPYGTTQARKSGLQFTIGQQF